METNSYAYSGSLKVVARGEVGHDSKASSQLAAIVALSDLNAKAGAGK